MTQESADGLWVGWRPFDVAPGRIDDIKQARVALAQAKQSEAQRRLLTYLETLGLKGVEILRGVSGLHIPDALVQSVTKWIDDELKGNERRWATNHFARGLERGRTELQWVVKVPPRVLRLQLPSPPLNVRNVESLHVATALRSVFIEALADPPEPPSPDAAFFVVLSAILFSGLLNPTDIEGFAKSAATGLRVRGIWAWVDWIDDQNVWHRVFLDTITLALLLRWRLGVGSTGSSQSTLVVWEPTGRAWANPSLTRSRSLLMRAGISLERADDVKTDIGRWSHVLLPAAAWWSLHMPGFLLEWSKGNLSSTVLPPRVWERIVADRPLADDEAVRDLDTSGRPFKHAGSEQAIPDPVSPWWTQLRSSLIASSQAVTKAQAKANLQRLLATPALTILQRDLCQWMLQAIETFKMGGQNLRVSTASLWLSTIDRRLYAVLNDKPDWSMDSQTLDALMMQVAQDVPPASRDTASNALRSFRVYLNKSRHVAMPDIDFSEGATRNVDVNLLSMAEMMRLRRVLLDAGRKSCWIAACLAWHGRLRRSELRGLRLADLVGGAGITLLVRARVPKKLKTASAQRQIALSALLHPEDHQLLEAHRAELMGARELAGVAEDAVFLFPCEDALCEPANEKDLIDPIVTAMKMVTGDEHIRFHHLRHTGVNHLVLTSMEHLSESVLEHPALGGVHAWRPDAHAVVASMVGEARPQRPRLWGIAIGTGHATPETTLGSYTHLCDWLRHHVTLASLPDLSDVVLARLSGVSVSNLRVIRLRNQGAARLALPSLQKRLDGAFPEHTREGGCIRLQPALTEADIRKFIGELAPEESPIWGQLALLKSAIPDDARLRKDRQQWRALPSRIMALGLDETRVAQWLDRAFKFDQKTTSERRSTGKPWTFAQALRLISFSVPGVPRGRGEREQTVALHRALKIWQGQDPNAVDAWLADYLMQRDADSHAVRLKVPELAMRWLRDCMMLVEQANEQISDPAWHMRVHVAHCPSSRARAAPSTQREVWESVIPNECLRSAAAQGSPGRQSRGTFGTLDLWIEPLAAERRVRQSGMGKSGHWARRAGAALSIAAYAMYVLAD